MKSLCTLCCILLIGSVDAAPSAVRSSLANTDLLPYAADGYAASPDDEDSYLPSSGSMADDFSVDKKKKKKKSHAS